MIELTDEDRVTIDSAVRRLDLPAMERQNHLYRAGLRAGMERAAVIADAVGDEEGGAYAAATSIREAAKE